MKNDTIRSASVGLLRVAGLSCVALCAAAPAFAAGLGTDERLSGDEMVDPNVIFLIDMSVDMSSPCDSTSTVSCWESAVDAINKITQHYNDARYGVFGTAETGSDDQAYPIAPVGSTAGEIQTALAALTPWTTTDVRNLSESLQYISDEYLTQVDPDNGVNDVDEGFTGDWNETPIAYSCSETHIIVLTRGRSFNDSGVTGSFRGATPSPDVMCDGAGYTSTGEVECYYDNVVTHLYNLDEAGTLTGTQRAIVHTVTLGTQDSLSEDLFSNAENQTAGEGVYTNAPTGPEILGSILDVMNDIKAGTYSRSTPVLTADDAFLIYTFFDIVGDNPLAEGHIRAYAIDNDPASATYGEIDYTGDPETTLYGGAVWDGGDLLVCRPVSESERNPEDRDGIGHRDIYTWDEYAAEHLVPADDAGDHRLGYDEEFGTAVAGDSLAQARYMDLSDTAWDLDDDGSVTGADYQKLIDFIRGYHGARFRYLDQEHGYWKLGDSPYSVPVVVTPRDEHYTNNTVYKAWLEDLEFHDVPSIVLLAANDGMLHAFRLDDDGATSTDDEAGQEMWAWVPGSLLLNTRNMSWEGRLIDLELYGRSFLMDGSPTVEDVWIDADHDNAQTVDEWHRIVVVQQGMGGFSTLALDITDPQSPEFLWEAYDNLPDKTAMGYSMGRPIVANTYDESGSEPVDRYVVFWGSGRAAPAGESTTGDYPGYAVTEPNLYLYAAADDWYSGGMSSPLWDPYDDGPSTAEHPDTDTIGSGFDLDLDGDGKLEYGYVSGSLAAVDTNNDGDVDVIYFPMTTTYAPATGSSETTGGPPNSASDQNHTWIMKAILDPSDPGNPTWCTFYDPVDGVSGHPGPISDGSMRPEVFYSITTAWLHDGGSSGRLGVYWGTGSPFSRATGDPGYFFAFADNSPNTCTEPEPLGCGTGDTVDRDGWMELDGGEGLASDPLVYAGVVYFTTYLPNADRCEEGEGRIYALDFETCDGSWDTDDDGTPDASYVSAGPSSGLVSNLAVSDQGTIFYAAPSGSSYTDPNLQMITPMQDDMKGTAAVEWMEMY